MQMKLENSDGAEIGKLQNFVLDLRSGQVKFLILSSGGYFGLGAKLHAVPPGLFSASTAKRDVLALNLPNGQLKRAPVFKTSDLAILSHPSKQNELTRYYAQSKTELAAAGISPKNMARLTPTGGTGTSSSDEIEPLQFASDLLGRTVVDLDHHKLGEVLDLLVSFDRGAPAMALISTGKLFRSRGRDYAVSLRALSLTRDRKVMINADQHLLERAPSFNESAWAGAAAQTNATQIFRYFAPN